MAPASCVHLSLEDWARFQRVFLTEGAGFLAAPHAGTGPGTEPLAGLGTRPGSRGLVWPAGLQHVLGGDGPD
jgi:hypothetical protein